MEAFKFLLGGRWGHFRRVDTNNNPLTHDFITKTALLGLGGAILGWDRQAMKLAFPILSEDLVYGCQLNRAVKKESWAFTLRNASKPDEKSPRPMEFLRDPDFTVVLGMKHERSADFFHEFARAVEEDEAKYTPVLGLQNCPAELRWLSLGELREEEGDYETSAFFTRVGSRLGGVLTGLRLGFDRIPSFQNSEWWNLPDMYKDVIYPANGERVMVTGIHHVFNNEDAWDPI